MELDNICHCVPVIATNDWHVNCPIRLELFRHRINVAAILPGDQLIDIEQSNTTQFDSHAIEKGQPTPTANFLNNPVHSLTRTDR